jgi:hypothetical protein
MCIRWLIQRTAGPHSTTLGAGSPRRYALWKIALALHYFHHIGWAKGPYTLRSAAVTF